LGNREGDDRQRTLVNRLAQLNARSCRHSTTHDTTVAAHGLSTNLQRVT
jgi:hypothetical protein